MELAFKLDGKKYQVERLTLGDARMIAAEFGVRDILDFDWTNVQYLAALCFLAFKQAHPHLSQPELTAMVDNVDLQNMVESVGEIAEAEAAKVAAAANPPKPAGTKPKRAKTGA